MAITKVSRSLLDTGVSDSSDATAITIDSSENVTFAGGLVIPSTITHAGDTDTKLDFNQANTLRLITGDNTAWVCDASSMVINEDSIDFDFRVESNSNTHMLFVDGGNDRVGINCTSPQVKFVVQETDGGTGIEFSMGASESYIQCYSRSASDYKDLSIAAENLKFRTDDNSERMRIASGGNVGIGDTSPIAKLTVKAASDTIRAESLATDAKNITMSYHDSNDQGQIFCGQDGVEDKNIVLRGHTLIFQRNGGTEAMRIASGGQLLVGTTTQRTFFDVQGTTTSDVMTVLNGSTADANVGMIVFRDGAADFCGQITSNGSSNTTAYNTSSDARLKNVLGEAKGLEVINQLNPVHFEWKKSGIKQDGLIAQEVDPIVPNVVTHNKESDVYSMDYSKLVTPLIKAIQEQQKEIEELKQNSHAPKTIEEMEGYEDLINRIKELENK